MTKSSPLGELEGAPIFTPMYPFFLYIIKVSLSLAAFYLFYKLLCSRDTWHRANRILLLTILALSAAVPFMYIDLGVVTTEATIILEELTMTFDAETVADGAQAATAVEPTLWQRIPWQRIPWHTLLASIYFIGLVVYLIKFIAGLTSIARLIRRSKCREMADGTILVTHTEPYGPFSWMRYIIVSERDLQENYDMILAHERAHIRLHHSWDLLFVQLCATAQWFNPAAWLLKRELEAIHEYEADSATLHEGFDAQQYQLRLFEAATGVKYSSFTNNFINCSTKKRIIMMMKKQTSPWALLKALYVLPVAFAAVAVISCTSPREKKTDTDATSPAVENVEEKNTPATAETTPTKTVEEGEIFLVVEDRPQFPGGDAELMKFLQQNIKYPKEAQEQGKQGRVIVQFVVNKDGSICEDTIIRSVDPQLDAEAIRVIRSMPNWTPGKQKGEPVRVRFTIPVTFRLQGGTATETAQPKKAEAAPTGDELFKVVEERPQFPGGDAELMKFLQQNVKYPKEAQDKGTQGRVIVRFTVEKDGSITSPEVIKPVDPLLDAEALRIVKMMPKWQPGKQRGKEVRVQFTIPVTFRLSN